MKYPGNLHFPAAQTSRRTQPLDLERGAIRKKNCVQVGCARRGYLPRLSLMDPEALKGGTTQGDPAQPAHDIHVIDQRRNPVSVDSVEFYGLFVWV